MRRFAALLIALVLVALAVPVRAAGTCTQTHATIGNVRKVLVSCTADAADGSFPTTVLPAIEGRIISLATNPGATAPQANYDITLPDQHGHDVLQALGMNRHTSNTEKVAIFYTSTSSHPTVDESDTLTLTIAANNVNSAITVIEITYALGG